MTFAIMDDRQVDRIRIGEPGAHVDLSGFELCPPGALVTDTLTEHRPRPGESGALAVIGYRIDDGRRPIRAVAFEAIPATGPLGDAVGLAEVAHKP
jgi:hypothetical protein